MFSSTCRRASWLAICCISLALGACHTKRDDLSKASPEVLYQRGHRQMKSFEFGNAIKTFEALNARFPFTDQARQARLDLMYSYYRQGERESTIDAADTFIRENPTHPRIDYAYYIKGLVDFERSPNAFEKILRVDLSARAPSNARKSFAAFSTIVEKYPNSDYAHDALQRMVYLRNRLASYEVNVARYYFKRGAYVAAAQRAKEAVDDYDGAPALREALQILVTSYDKLDLPELSARARALYEENYGGQISKVAAADAKPWWKFW